MEKGLPFSWRVMEMVMIKLKDCPRCGSHIFLDHDQYGWYLECLKCGYHHDVKVKPTAIATTLQSADEKMTTMQ